MLRGFRLLPKRYVFFAFCCAFFLVVSAVLDFISPQLLASLLGVMHHGLSKEWIVTILPNASFFLPVSFSGNLVAGIISAIIIGASLLSIAFCFFSYFLSAVISTFAAKELRYTIFVKIQTLSFKELETFGEATLLSRVTNDVVQIQNAISMFLRVLGRAVVYLVLGIVFAAIISPTMSWSFVAIIPLLVIVLIGLGRLFMPSFSKLQRSLDDVNNSSQENILGNRAIRSFNLQKIMKDKFIAANNRWLSSSFKSSLVMPIISTVVNLVINFGIFAALVITSVLVHKHESGHYEDFMYIEQYQQFYMYLTYAVMGVIFFAIFSYNYSRSFVCSRRINKVMNLQPSIVSPVNATAKVMHGKVQFNNVSLNYLGANSPTEPSLRSITFTAYPGSFVGIIGQTGCGKSSLVNLIARLYDCTAGNVTIDDIDIKDYSLDELHSSVGIVLQDSFLFSGTIAENIKFSNTDASYETMVKAAEVACADGFIQTREKKYEDIVEQRGKNFSGGQKQRISIARTILQKPKILILDDSTSALDVLTEKKVRDNIKSTLSDTTIFMVAQRISAVREADCILVLDNGLLVGAGKHDELINNNQIYKEIYSNQLEVEDH